MDATRITQKRAELADAEIDLAAGHKALATHGHQSVTWMLFRYAATKVNRLRAEVAEADTLRNRVARNDRELADMMGRDPRAVVRGLGT